MHKLKDNSRNILIEYLIPILSFIIPLHKSLAAPLVSIIFLISIFQISRKNLNVINLIISISYFVILCIGLLYSNNISKGFFELEISISFLIFPLIFFFIGKMEEKIYKKIKAYFLEGVLISIVACLLISTYNFIFLEMGNSTFFYDQLSHFHHTSYASMYICFATFIAFEKIIKEGSNFVSLTSVIVVFNVFNFMLLSKTGILLMILIDIAGVIIIIKKHKTSILKVTLLFASLVTILGSLTLIPTVTNRLSDLNLKNLLDSESELSGSSSSRLITWETSWELFKKNRLVGVGTGDFDDEMRHLYFEQGKIDIANKTLNSHNQYLQILAKNGLVGFLIFLFLIGNSIYKVKDIIFHLFIIVLLFNCVTESILQTQSGVIFTAFFIFLYRFKSNRTKPLVL